MPQDNLEGLVQLQAGLVPTNDNPRAWVTWQEYVRGADQTFQSINDLVAYHPNRMIKGMRARVIDYPLPGNVSDFEVAVDPSTMVDGNGDSLITDSNFFDYWALRENVGTTTGFERVYEYAPDASGGGAPVFPYTVSEESNWEPIYDATKNHKWIRFRDDDVDANTDGIFDNWTLPIPINQSYESGDYIDIRFRREATDNTIRTSTVGLVDTKYYIVLQGTVTNTTDNVTNYKGKIFQYLSAKSYTFSSAPAGQVQEFVTPIARTTAGAPNNEPTGWTDTVPAGTDQLWKATAQKSVYGQLKSAWIVTRVQEDANYIRYSSSASPHPDTIAGVDVDAGTGQNPGDADLIAAGWSSAYGNETFMATRSDDQNPSSPKYTTWTVQKISEESGEYIDRVFKLLPVGLDTNDPLIVTPVLRDPTQEGWNDTPLEETANEINYFSEARKFFDGTLKSVWSKPFPYTGRDTIVDSITSDLGDSFKTGKTGVTTPTEIVLTANLFRGDTKLWEQTGVSITYSWKKIYDNGAVVDVSPTAGTGEFHTKAATGGAPGAGEFLADQRVGIEPTAVTGKAVFECTQTYNPGGGAPVLTYVQTFSIIDVTDGVDTKDLSVRVNTPLAVWDVTDTVFAPGSVNLTAFQSNLPTGNTFYWYEKIADTWTEITAADDNHIFPNGVNGNSLNVTFVNGTETAVSDIVFTVPGTGADAQITSALSELPAMVALDEFIIAGHPDPENNGLYTVVTVNTSTSDYEVDKITASATTPITATAQAVTVDTSLSKIFNTDASAQEYQYAVTNTQTNPDAADYATKFSDYITIGKLGSTSTGTSGENAVAMLLTNESHTIGIDDVTGNPLANQIGATGTAVTTVQLYNGATKLDYNVDYAAGNITVSTESVDTGTLTDVTFNWQANGTDFDVYVDTWVGANGPRNAVGRIEVVYNSITYVKYFTINSTVDGAGTQLLDIDSNKGYSFTPTDRTDKTLSASFYDENTLDTSDDYRYRWLLDTGAGFTEVQAKTARSSSGHLYTLTSAQIQGEGFLRCEIYTFPADVLLRTRTVTITDITDAKAYPVFYDYGSDQSGNEPLSAPTTPSPSSISGFAGDFTANPTGSPGWFRNPGTWTYWTSQGVEDEAKVLNFTAAVRVRGEKGDQGSAGGYFVEQYNTNGGDDVTPPATPNAYPDTGDGWQLALPVADVIWVSRTQADSGGTPINNSNWTAPYLLTGKDGIDGNNGATGATGPGYNNITDLGINGSGNRDIRFEGVNGAPDVDIEVIKGDTGDTGVTDGLSKYRWSAGNTGGSYFSMGNFQQGITIDVGDPGVFKRLMIKGWVTCGTTNRWCTLRIKRGTTSSYTAGTTVSQRNYYNGGSPNIVMQWTINATAYTSDRYISLSFSDVVVDGNSVCTYGDYGLEVKVI